jgi:PAS domain S-box-containing protein
VLLSVGVFLLDLSTPLGRVVPGLYLIPLLLTLGTSERRAPLFLALATTALTILGAVYAPSGASVHTVVFNRTTALGMIWVTTLLIVQRHRAEFALRASGERFRAIVQASPIAMAISREADGLIFFANELLGRLLGLPAHELVGRKATEFYQDPAVRQALLSRLQNNTPLGSNEITIVKVDGTLVWVLASVQRLTVDGQRVLLWGLQDITERKQAEKALRESERRTRLIVEMALDAVIVMDEEGRIRDWNAQAETIFGWSRQEAIDRSLATIIIPPPYREAHQLGLQRFLVTGEGPLLNKRIEITACHRDGSEFPVELTITPARWGGRYTFSAFVRDLRERKRAEEILRQNQELLRGAFNYAAIGMALVAPDGRWLQVNRALCDIVGYSEQELLATTFQAITYPDDLQTDLNYVRQMLAGEIQTYQMEKRYLHKLGHVVWVLLNVSLVRDPQGKPLFFISQIQDMTAHKRTEEAHRLLLESTDEGIYGIDLDGRCTFVNASGAAMLGYHPDEVVGQNMHELVHHTHPDGSPYPVDECPIFRAFRTGQGCRGDHEVLWRRDGTTFPVEYSSYPIREKNFVKGAVVMFTDISERMLLEEQLLQSQKMDAVGKLAGGIAHDFNNLMLVINGYSQLLLSRLEPRDPLREDIEHIKQAGERAAELTQQLLAFSRRQVLRPKVLDLNTVVVALSPMLQRVLGEHIDLATALEPALDHVKVDPGQLEQALVNLTVNARDAMPEGGKVTIETLNATVDTSSHHTQTIPPGPYVVLIVSDTGCGMDAETQARIFEPFFTTKEFGQGTGLGLSMVYGIVKQNSGDIVVYSEPGRGATFKIYLPRVDEPLDVIEPPHPSVALPRGTETILLVEDEPQARALVRDTLRQHGYAVLEARHGVEALVSAAQHPGPIHLLVTDVIMPQMSGPQVAQRLMPIRPDMKVLYMSGYTENAVVHHGVLDPGVAFLHKPFSMEVLARKVREVLDTSC